MIELLLILKATSIWGDSHLQSQKSVWILNKTVKPLSLNCRNMRLTFANTYRLSTNFSYSLRTSSVLFRLWRKKRSSWRLDTRLSWKSWRKTKWLYRSSWTSKIRQLKSIRRRLKLCHSRLQNWKCRSPSNSKSMISNSLIWKPK